MHLKANKPSRSCSDGWLIVSRSSRDREKDSKRSSSEQRSDGMNGRTESRRHDDREAGEIWIISLYHNKHTARSHTYTHFFIYHVCFVRSKLPTPCFITVFVVFNISVQWDWNLSDSLSNVEMTIVCGDFFFFSKVCTATFFAPSIMLFFGIGILFCTVCPEWMCACFAEGCSEVSLNSLSLNLAAVFPHRDRERDSLCISSRGVGV